MTVPDARADRIFALEFDELRVGDAYSAAPRRIGATEVDGFASLTGDRHPLHVDDQWAADGPFGARIAHGMLTLSCALGALPLDPERVLALRRVRDAVFKRPVYVGERIAVGCRVTGARPLDEGTGLVDCELRVLGDDGRLRARGVVELLWRRAGGRPRGVSGAAISNYTGAIADPLAERELAPVEVSDDGLRVLI